MRVRKQIILLAIILAGLPIFASISQSQHVNNLPLLAPEIGPETFKTIPIWSYNDSLFVMCADFDYYGVCDVIGAPSWYYRFESNSIRQGMEFMVSPQGGFYVYDNFNSKLMFNFSGSAHDERYCPGRPVFDQNDRIHSIEEVPGGNFVYIVSDDTLNSLNYIDTLANFPQFYTLVANPEHSTVGAVFFDRQNDQIFKYLSVDGYIDFANPTIFDVPIYYLWLFDMTLDEQNKIISVLGAGDFNVNIYTWTEDFGYSYLDFSPDPVLEPVLYQISLGENGNEIIVIKNFFSWYFEYSRFFYSSDAGNSWHRSLFEIPDAAYGSSLRTFGDTLHFVYSIDMFGNGDTYYNSILIVSISGNLTSISDEEITPENISLLRAYPNPFNARTTIEFTLAGPGDVELTIFDITGAKVETIRRPGLDAGIHSIVWDAEDAASGVYFARMEAGGESKSIKMVLLK